jgi:subtilase family serine protease
VKRIVAALAGCAVCAALAATVATGAAGGGKGRVTLPGSTPSWANGGNYKSAANASDWVNFRVYLGLRNQAQAEAAAQAVSTPGSSSYGKYLTPAQFDSQYAPTSAEVSAVTSWLKSQGLSVDYVPSNNHYVAAEGTVAQVQDAFQVKLNQYSVRGLTLRAPSGDLSVPDNLADVVAGVVGVDQSMALVEPFGIGADAGPSPGFRNAGPCSSYYGEKTTADTQVTDPTSPYSPATLPDYKGSPRPFAPCGYAGAQLQSAYGVADAIAKGYTGKGVTVAIIDAFASPTIVQDTNQYFSNHGLPTWKNGQFTQVVAPGTYNHPESPAQDPQGWYGEETLDVEAVHTMAPGANVVYVGSPNNYQDLDAAMNHVVANHLADIVTNSYGFSTELLPPGYVKPLNDTMLQGVLEGIGIYFSSGDNGDETDGGPASTARADWPAVSPYVTAVGGTTLAVGKDDTYLFETGWGTMRNRLNCTGFLQRVNQWCGKEVYLYGSGGGTSRIFAQPWYQAGVVPSSLATRWSSTPARVIPDVSAVGDPNTGMLVGQTQQFSTGSQYDEYRIGGTSLSSPLMAGIMAVAQQEKGSPLGFANPALYALYAKNPAAFHDVQHVDGAVVRADYVNGENASNGILFSTRSFDQTWTLATTPGYDDVTGLGSPTYATISGLAGK